MGRKAINDTDLEKVVGGSIIIKPDHSTCGYNRNDQYKFLDYDKALDYMVKNYGKVSEQSLLDNCVELGYIVSIE